MNKRIKVISAVVGLTVLVSGCAAEEPEPEEISPTVVESRELSNPLDPQPLPERTTLVVSAVANLEVFTPLYVADVFGEFEKENIEIEIALLPATEAVPALALGQVDVSAVGITPTLFNLVSEGVDIRIVYPGPSSAEGDGLWMSTEWLDTESMDGTIPRIVTPTGPGLLDVPVYAWLENQGYSREDIVLEHLPLSEIATALDQGIYDGAWLHSPTFLPFAENRSASLVSEYPDGQTGIGYAFGPRLLAEEPEVGEAFLRALLRAQVTYLAPGYKSDSQLMGALAQVLDRTPEQLQQTAELTFLTEFDTTLYDQGQEVWLALGDILNYDRPLPASAFIDTGILDGMTEAMAEMVTN
jgi:NitT/TauT family transport system substrate-binding protein